MEGALWGMGTLFVSAVGWIAYKHPKSYGRIGGALVLISWAVLLMAWFTYTGMEITVAKLIAEFKLDGVKAAATLAPDFQRVTRLGICAVLFSLYAGALLFLPYLIDLDEGKSDKQ